MAFYLRRQLLMSFATLIIVLFSSFWMFFGSGPLSFGLSAPVLFWEIDLHFSQSSLLGGPPNYAKESILPDVSHYSGASRLDDNAILPYDNSTLGIASEIYVLSLAHRTDRRATMERLKQALALQWTYVRAVQSEDQVISKVLADVRNIRRIHESQVQDELGQQFDWPDDSDLDALSRSTDALDLAGSGLWTSLSEDPDPHYIAPETFPTLSSDEQGDGPPYHPHHLQVGSSDPSITFGPDLSPLTCATGNRISGPEYVPSLPAYMTLTPAKVACWMSHLEVIRRIANSDVPPAFTPAQRINNASMEVEDSYTANNVGIILEDDIDMERDIHGKLQEIWGALPAEWDIVFLGHCWSNESYYPALTSLHLPVNSQSKSKTALHPSFAPKCTHAYALTRTGARRLLLHLRHPPFAYSRAIDQALAWLVQSGRLKAFSVVPSLIVQRKVAESDIDSGGSGIGSAWREHLENGVFGS